MMATNSTAEQPVVGNSPAWAESASHAWHRTESEEAVRLLEADLKRGLSAGEAARRLAVVGPNRLPAPSKEGLMKRFFKHFHDLLIYILLGAAGVTAALAHWVDTGVILAVVLINAIIGFIQEGKAKSRALRSRACFPTASRG